MATAAVTLNEPIEWEGGECPVSPDTRVQVQFRTDRDWAAAERINGPGGFLARNVSWWNTGSDGDVVAYRVVR